MGLVPKQTMRVIYLFKSIFQYGMLVWEGSGETILNKLQVNQNNKEKKMHIESVLK